MGHEASLCPECGRQFESSLIDEVRLIMKHSSPETKALFPDLYALTDNELQAAFGGNDPTKQRRHTWQTHSFYEEQSSYERALAKSRSGKAAYERYLRVKAAGVTTVGVWGRKPKADHPWRLPEKEAPA